MCERCCERSMYEKAQGICRCRKWVAEDERVVEQLRWWSQFKGGHGLQRNMEKEGRGLIWCRQCAGYSIQCLRKKLRNALCTNKVDPSRRSDRIGSMKTQTSVNFSRSQDTSDWRELTDKKSKIDKERTKQIQPDGPGIARKKTKLKLNMKKSRMKKGLSEKENRDSIVSAVHEYAVPETSKVDWS